MPERELPRVKLERRRAGSERLGVAGLPVWQIGGIARDGKSELPEMHADLVGPAGAELGLQQRGAVRAALDDLEIRARGQAFDFIHHPGAHHVRLGGNRRFGEKHVLRRMAERSNQVALVHLAFDETAAATLGRNDGCGRRRPARWCSNPAGAPAADISARRRD